MFEYGLIMVLIGILAELPLSVSGFAGHSDITMDCLALIGCVLNIYGLVLVAGSKKVNSAWAFLAICGIVGAIVGTIIVLALPSPIIREPAPVVHYCKRCGRPLPKSGICSVCDGNS